MIVKNFREDYRPTAGRYKANGHYGFPRHTLYNVTIVRNGAGRSLPIAEGACRCVARKAHDGKARDVAEARGFGSRQSPYSGVPIGVGPAGDSRVEGVGDYK